MTAESILSGHVLTRPDERGIRLVVENRSNGPLEVTFPNPYTGVQLFDLQGTLIPHSSFLCWEHNDPRLLLDPAETVSASINCFPFWTDVSGDVLAKCAVIVRSAHCEQQIQYVDGVVRLMLPSALDL